MTPYPKSEKATKKVENPQKSRKNRKTPPQKPRKNKCPIQCIGYL